MYSCELLQSSVSHDPWEIILICWFDAQEIIIINVETINAKIRIISGFFDE